MKCGICICGLNGSGKTTLALELAKELNFKHMDVEDYYFTTSEKPYSSSRTREQVEQLLLQDIEKYPCFVFSAVNGNMPEINSLYDVVIYLDASADIRMKRIKQRAIDKFGDRVLPGGDMYEQEEKFFEFASKREDTDIKNWINTLSCEILYLDGTNSICQNTQKIITHLNLKNASLV